MKRNRGEGELTLYPDPDLWRQKLTVFYKRLAKEQEEWRTELATDGKQKVIITIPGDVVEDKQALKKTLQE